MLYGIAFVTIFVAAITSIFVTRAAEERGIAEDQAEQRIEARLDGIDDRLASASKSLLRKLIGGTLGRPPARATAQPVAADAGSATATS